MCQRSSYFCAEATPNPRPNSFSGHPILFKSRDLFKSSDLFSDLFRVLFRSPDPFQVTRSFSVSFQKGRQIGVPRKGHVTRKGKGHVERTLRSRENPHEHTLSQTKHIIPQRTQGIFDPHTRPLGACVRGRDIYFGLNPTSSQLISHAKQQLSQASQKNSLSKSIVVVEQIGAAPTSALKLRQINILVDN